MYSSTNNESSVFRVLCDTLHRTSPLDPNVKLSKSDAEADTTEMATVPYATTIGSLMYMAIGTQPDIAYTVQALSQFSSNPGLAHWTAAKQVLQYLKTTKNAGITYRNTPDLALQPENCTELIAYSDADWARNIDDQKSTSGNVFLLGGGVISWSSKKQTTMALSSMEAEYITLSHATHQVIWIRHLLANLGFMQNRLTKIHADNQSAIELAKETVFHSRSKHINIWHHFICEKIGSSEISTPYIHTDKNLANLLTKALTKPKHNKFMNSLGMLTKLAGEC